MDAVPRIKAVIVNHDTSLFAELALRSLFARNRSIEGLEVEIRDNGSKDDMSELWAYAEEKGIPIVRTPWETDTSVNSHGETLKDFALSNPEVPYLLFLDADAMFCQDDTLETMLAELDGASDAFAVSGRMSWDGEREIPPGAVWDGRTMHMAFVTSMEGPPAWPGEAEPCRIAPTIMGRCHPFCALVRNTPPFQSAARELGFSGAVSISNGDSKSWDTFGLATSAMRTHGLRHIVSSKLVYHFCCVTYERGPALEEKRARCRSFIERLKERP
jgi:hypothetical protein